MPLTPHQKKVAWTIFRLVAERDMPSNNTAERLIARSGLAEEEVLWALDFLWCDDTGYLRCDIERRSGIRGYYVDPKCKRKTLNDLDTLYDAWQEVLEDRKGQDDEDDDDFDPDDEWSEMDADWDDD